MKKYAVKSAIKRFTLTVFAFILLWGNLRAQPGKDGALAITSQSQVVNKYYPVAQNISAGSLSMVLASANVTTICHGDLLMIYQAQGAGINTSNNVNYGSITNFNSAGLYELKYVQSVNGNTVTLQSAFSNSYVASGKVQAIRVPQFSTLTVQLNASIMAKTWKDTAIGGSNYRMGGIVAIHSQSLLNNGTITASGQGFRGGAQDMTNTFVQSITNFASTNITEGGEKGESIAGFQQDYDNNGGRYCMGAPANGGGGGNAHNAAGGGGANGFNGNTWTGQGIMVANAASPLAAWALSAGYAANGNNLTNSSGGGHGGYSWGNTNLNALVTGPGIAQWQGDSRREVGGTGGRPLQNIVPGARIYFGGGGGAAEANNLVVPGGASGGGIVLLMTPNGITGFGAISSNGNTALNTFGSHNEGVSGGGAGGSIVIMASFVVPGQTITANGGDGGSQGVPGPPAVPDESDGPGGGGGGGLIAVGAGPSAFVNGGINGSTAAPSMTEFIANGATNGANGQVLPPPTNIPSYVGFSIGSNSPLCTGAVLNLTTSASGATSYIWSGPNGFTSPLQNPNVVLTSTLFSGTYSFNALYAGSCTSTQSTLNVNVLQGPSMTILTGSLLCLGQSATLAANGADTYLWNTGANTGTIIVTPSITTGYTVTGTNTLTGCTSQATQTISVVTTASVNISGGPGLCVGQTATLTASGANTFSWNTGATVPSIVITPTVNTIYSVNGQSGPGCSGSASLMIIVNPLPTVTLGANASKPICKGESVAILSNVNGANIYSWNTGATSNNIFVTPSVSTIYSLIVTNSVTGCKATASINIFVEPCTGLTSYSEAHNVKVFPNPFVDCFSIEGADPGSLFEIYDLSGRRITSGKIEQGNTYINLSKFPKGIYYLKVYVSWPMLFKIVSY